MKRKAKSIEKEKFEDVVKQDLDDSNKALGKGYIFAPCYLLEVWRYSNDDSGNLIIEKWNRDHPNRW